MSREGRVDASQLVPWRKVQLWVGELRNDSCKVRACASAPERRKRTRWCFSLLLYGCKPHVGVAAWHLQARRQAARLGPLSNLLRQQTCAKSQTESAQGQEHLSNCKCQILALYCTNNMIHTAPAIGRL